MSKWDSKINDMIALAKNGATLEELGQIYGITRERVRQLLRKYAPQLTREFRGKHIQISGRSTKISRCYNMSDFQKACHRAFSRKKQNAKVTGYEWTIDITDITWPTICPILGLELDWFAESRQENSPSFDRIDSSKGYVPGNVQIISWRANRIKNDGTALEHRKIAEYLENL